MPDEYTPLRAAPAPRYSRRTVAAGRTGVPAAKGGTEGTWLGIPTFAAPRTPPSFVAQRATTRLAEPAVTVVEIDGEVARFRDGRLNPRVFRHPRIALRIEDAAVSVEGSAIGGGPRFDGAVVDLTDVPVAAGASSVASFYERVLAATWHLLDDGGWISVQSGKPDAAGVSRSSTARLRSSTRAFAGSPRTPPHSARRGSPGSPRLWAVSSPGSTP